MYARSVFGTDSDSVDSEYSINSAKHCSNLEGVEGALVGGRSGTVSIISATSS